MPTVVSSTRYQCYFLFLLCTELGHDGIKVIPEQQAQRAQGGKEYAVFGGSFLPSMVQTYLPSSAGIFHGPSYFRAFALAIPSVPQGHSSIKLLSDSPV